MNKFYISFLLIVFVVLGCGATTGPNDIKLINPKQAVADARMMMEGRRADPKKYEGWIYAKDLPDSLKLPGLYYASVYEDHVNLVIGRNPDWQVGARIWASDSKLKHEDKKTSYPDVYFFQYCNDLPASPSNIE